MLGWWNVYIWDLKSHARKGLGVQIPPLAPLLGGGRDDGS